MFSGMTKQELIELKDAVEQAIRDIEVLEVEAQEDINLLTTEELELPEDEDWKEARDGVQ